MIKINKKDVVISYIGNFLRLFSNIMILPVIVHKIPSEEYGIWVIFLSIGAFTILLDLGSGAVLVRYTTYAYCGAKSIPKTGLPNIQNSNQPNYNLLFTVLLCGRRIYGIISILATCALAILTLYIYYIANGDINIFTVMTAWGLYASGIVLSIFYQYYSSFYKGLGKVKELQLIGITNQVVYILFQLLLLYLGFGIIALAAANLIASILLRFQLSVKINKLIKKNIEEFKNAKMEFYGKFKTIYNSVAYNSKGIGLVLISNYIQSQGIILICSAFIDLQTIGRFGLTTQLIGIISTLAAVPFSTYLPRLSSLQLTSKNEELKDAYSLVTIISFILFFLGGIILLFTGEKGLSIINSKITILPQSKVIILLIYYFILTNHQRCTNFISLGNTQPYIRAYIVSSIATLALSLIALYFGMGLWGLIISNLLVQIAYNGWKWPYEALKINEISMTEMFIRVYRLAIKQI